MTRECTVASCLIVLTFVTSQLVPFANHIIEVTELEIAVSNSLVYVGNISVAFGSSINIFIYCASGSRFRAEFARIFTGCAVRRMGELCGRLRRRFADRETAGSRSIDFDQMDFYGMESTPV